MADFRTKRINSVSFKPNETAAKATTITGIEKRRGVRVNSQVLVAVEWDSGDGLLRGEAKTRVVGPYGCLVVLKKYLNVDQRVQLTNLANGNSSPAVVVWCGNERAEGWEVGIELINPEMNFWGLDL